MSETNGKDLTIKRKIETMVIFKLEAGWKDTWHLFKTKKSIFAGNK
jgi:hypothetical protein